MFGFIIGTACLVGFIAVYRRGAHGQGLFGVPRWLFRKLDTSPAQERVVRNAMASVKGEVRQFARDGKDARRELADILRADDFDSARVKHWFETREQDFSKVRESFVSALGEVYDVLDDHQRSTLASLVEKAPLRGAACRSRGPYRSHGEQS
jgi:Spy/CpxP family protein refolding chaperone